MKAQTNVEILTGEWRGYRASVLRDKEAKRLGKIKVAVYWRPPGEPRLTGEPPLYDECDLRKLEDGR